jgi:hypothetical protein
MKALLDYRDPCLEEHITDGDILPPFMAYITHGPTYPEESYLTSAVRPERKQVAAIWLLKNDDGELNGKCFAIVEEVYQDTSGNKSQPVMRRWWTLSSWVTRTVNETPKAIEYYINSCRPKHAVQLELFGVAA